MINSGMRLHATLVINRLRDKTCTRIANRVDYSIRGDLFLKILTVKSLG